MICPQVPAGSSSSFSAARPAGSPLAAQALQGYPISNPHRLGQQESEEEEQPPPPSTLPPQESYLRAGIDVGGLLTSESAL